MNNLTNQYGLTNIQYNLLYSAYYLPNIILPFIGGALSDFIGVRARIFGYSLILLIG